MSADNGPSKRGDLKLREVPSEAQLFKWGEQVYNCGGKHDRARILENVRKITSLPIVKEFAFSLPSKRKEYNIDASWVTIPGVEENISRDVCMDAVIYAGIIFYGGILDNGLSKRNFEEVCKHHCVEGVIRLGNYYGVESGDSVKVLNFYVQLVAGYYHAT
jgi:hypothetical protein